ncbi:MAG TPA: C4-dicarboxylate ABC transporter substrate-binding protein [Gammaproteobacteria bacterium]|jgi:TRAP-type C4-dicarboxylate transport system substrate-binding protein|nr:C4-dicarboxylate ABC transporter substrate-binding protein [Gammaproteobacteria bacterium]
MLKVKQLVQAVAVVAGLGFSSMASAATTLHVGTWLPAGNPQNSVVWPTWAKWVEEATEGRVKVKLEYDLGHPKKIFQLVEDGVVDAGFSYHGYVPGRFKLPQIVEQPGLNTNAEAASVALWRVYNKHFLDAGEFDGLVLLGMFTHGPGYIHSIKPIESVADIKGKKIRIGGGVQSELGELMGITPVAAPAPKVYEMLQQGVVDGVFMPMAEQKVLRLNEVAKNVTMIPGGMYLGSFSMFINPDFLDSLDPKDREAIQRVSGEQLSALAGKAWDGSDKTGYETAKTAGVNLIELAEDDAMTAAFRQLTQDLDNKWIESVADRKVDASAALAELKRVAANYKPE